MAKSDTIVYLPGDIIFKEGEFGDNAYLIETGEVEIVKFTGDENIILAELEKGALFGEMAIIDGSPRSSTARAKTDCVLTSISETKLKKYLSSSPESSLTMMRRLSGYARSANEKLSKDAFDEVEENDGIKKQLNKKSIEIDSQTYKTLKAFNDDIDDFKEISPDRTLWYAGITILSMTILFLFWASISYIDVTVSTKGQILTEIPNVDVQSNYASVIKSIKVVEGQHVKKGQILAVFDETLLASDIRDKNHELETLNKDIDRLGAEINFVKNDVYLEPQDPIQAAIFKNQIEEIKLKNTVNVNKLSQLNNKRKLAIIEINETLSNIKNKFEPEISKLDGDIFKTQSLMKLISGQSYDVPNEEPFRSLFLSAKDEYVLALDNYMIEIKYLTEELIRSEKLRRTSNLSNKDFEQQNFKLQKLKNEKAVFHAKQVAEHFNKLEQFNVSRADLTKEIENAEFKLAKKRVDLDVIEAEISENRIEYKQFVSVVLKDKNKELNSLNNQKSKLIEQLLKLRHQQQDVDLLSPIDGVVLELVDNFKGSVVAQGDVLMTIVPDDLNFHVLVDISPNDITNVFEGAKVKVLMNSLPSQKHGELIGNLVRLSKDTVDQDVFGENNTVYRGEIEIVENNLRELPDGFQLLPGMNVSGNIISGKRSVISYLIFPILKTIQTSFREP